MPFYGIRRVLYAGAIILHKEVVSEKYLVGLHRGMEMVERSWVIGS